jgi:hypothetical protein
MKGQNFLTVTGLQHNVGYNLRREKTFSEREKEWEYETSERENEKEGRMPWAYVGAGILMWQCLKDENKFLSASSFNLYYRLLVANQCIAQKIN